MGHQMKEAGLDQKHNQSIQKKNIPNLPSYITLTFGLTTLATLALFVWTFRSAYVETVRKKSTVILIGGNPVTVSLGYLPLRLRDYGLGCLPFRGLTNPIG
jgi:hypothetical protein